MVEEKNWYESKTIWGALIAVLASISGAVGLSIETGAQAELAEVMVQMVGAIGALFAIYGRLSATDMIS